MNSILCKEGNKATVQRGLYLHKQDHIGRIVRFKNPQCLSQLDFFEIVGHQMAWGYDKDGNYSMIPAFRVQVLDPEMKRWGRAGAFGKAAHYDDVEFVSIASMSAEDTKKHYTHIDTEIEKFKIENDV